jgi:hypothetical protein
MGDLASVQSSTSLANIDAALQARALAMKQSIQVGGQNINIQKNGTFRLPNGEERDVLDMVIVDYKYRNQFYSRPYRKGEFSPADCFAIGDDPTAMNPHVEAPVPVHPTCLGCPKNEFGSALNGGAGKACQNQLLLAIMFADLAESEEVYVLKASPTMVKAIAGHVVKLAEHYGHPIKAITRFGVDSSGDYPKLTAAFAGPNPDYTSHARFLGDADRALTSAPKKNDAGVDSSTNATSSAQVRANRRVS